MSGGKLILVPTPIGNLGDMTPRALDVLKSCHTVLAEDTRTTGKLLRHFGVDAPLKSFHQHNEHRSLEAILSQLKAGSTFALCSDAGTPGISDPGFLLVRACVEAAVKVECLPGATAFVPALVLSGLPCDRFYFEGFLPTKKDAKNASLPSSRCRAPSSCTRVRIVSSSSWNSSETLGQENGKWR